MEPQVQRELEILSAIEEGTPLTQRALAQRLGVALGLTNLYLKRLAGKGLIKVREFPSKPHARKRLRYVLTPKGVAEKARLTYEYMSYSLRLFRRTRDNLREALVALEQNGMKRIALYGVGEAAELAYLTLRELGLEPVAIYASGVGEPQPRAGAHFLGFPVRPAAELVETELDGIIVASFERPERCLDELAGLGVPRAKLLPLRRPAETGARSTRGGMHP